MNRAETEGPRAAGPDGTISVAPGQVASIAALPIEIIDTDPEALQPEPGRALCLSGGGYRAMLFHLGALWRLNEAGQLPTLDRVSSVSGGSIVAGALGLAWSSLEFDASGVAREFASKVVEPVREIAARTLDVRAVLLGLLGPKTISQEIAAAYRRFLFGEATLQDLPDRPRFVINCTNLQSGALWRFMKPSMRDWRVGEVRNPTLPLARAVAASSAFPPVLSPVVLHLEPSDFTPDSGHGLQRRPFTTNVVLTDGGVYDNLGLETAWKRYQSVLVSDGGATLRVAPRPKRDWARQAYRVLNVIDNQVTSLRKRQLIQSYVDGLRKGAYWGIRSHIADFHLADPLPAPEDLTLELADLPTRLKALEGRVHERLINWGYAICDAGLRRHVDPGIPKPEGFPYPGGVG